MKFSVLGAPCSDLAVCDDPSSNIYMYHLYSMTHYVHGPVYSNYKAYYCNVENICSCSPGYKRTANGLGCQPSK
ncbi:hypothetical protein DPMN_133249 [Dreissena polymorpha]|uniref:Uncharacterized protein n=1 Tax=Dreissena polymorpha TaxID=45954 RepID=A0A9D4FUV9_DREPO|nr:hypothetical protein DPMN_133249 [Dreissena polymorpha]